MDLKQEIQFKSKKARQNVVQYKYAAVCTMLHNSFYECSQEVWTVHLSSVVHYQIKYSRALGAWRVTNLLMRVKLGRFNFTFETKSFCNLVPEYTIVWSHYLSKTRASYNA